MLKDIIAIIDTGDKDDSFIHDALAFARFHDTHLTFVMVVPTVSPDYAMLVEPTYFQISDYAKSAENKQARVVALARHEKVEVRLIRQQSDALMDQLVVQSRYADLVLLGQPEAYGTPKFRRAAAETISLGSGRPVLIITPGMTPCKWNHIVVGWNSSPEATRALHDAIAFIEPGSKIDIAIVDPVESDKGHGEALGQDIARHLSRHDFVVEVHSISSVSTKVSTALMDLTRKRGADLLVIGVIAHSGFYKFVMGGVTDDVLYKADVPVFLAH